jgi:hypothetical protein
VCFPQGAVARWNRVIVALRRLDPVIVHKEEVFFCEKDSQGRTSVYGLQDIQNVRRTDNRYRKYLSGVYGAVPRLG